MEKWDLALVIIAGYVGVTALVRLLVSRRKVLVDELLEQVEQEKKANEAANPPKTERTETVRRAA